MQAEVPVRCPFCSFGLREMTVAVGLRDAAEDIAVLVGHLLAEHADRPLRVSLNGAVLWEDDDWERAAGEGS